MRKSLSLVILAAASLTLGGMESCLAQGASDTKPNAAPAKPGMHKQKMSNGRSSAGQAPAAKAEYSHRAMRKKLKKTPPQPQQPKSQRLQPTAKR